MYNRIDLLNRENWGNLALIVSAVHAHLASRLPWLVRASLTGVKTASHPRMALGPGGSWWNR